MKRWHELYIWIVLACSSSSYAFRIKKTNIEVAIPENAGEIEPKRHGSFSASAPPLNSPVDTAMKRRTVERSSAYEPVATSAELRNLTFTGRLHKRLSSQFPTFFPVSLAQLSGNIASRRKEVSTSQLGLIISGTILAVLVIVGTVIWYLGMRIEVKYAGKPRTPSDSSDDSARRLDGKKPTVTFAPGTKASKDANDAEAEATEEAFGSFLVEEQVTHPNPDVRSIMIRLPTLPDQAVGHTMTSGSETPTCMQHALSTGSEYQFAGMNTSKTTKSQVHARGRLALPDDQDAGSGGSRSPRNSLDSRSPRNSLDMCPQDTIASIATPLDSSEDGSDKGGRESPPLAAPADDGIKNMRGASDAASSHEAPDVPPDKT